jgi:hypothetical protein
MLLSAYKYSESIVAKGEDFVRKVLWMSQMFDQIKKIIQYQNLFQTIITNIKYFSKTRPNEHKVLRRIIICVIQNQYFLEL